MSRPEHQAPPDIFYNATEARKYAQSTRMIEIQAQMSERAVELLSLPDDGQQRFLLDIGCGSGLSGIAISEEGHSWVGVDISGDMLDVAQERGADGDLIRLDMGQGIPFRLGTFDGAISISALQWLCNADASSHDPRKRLKKFFETLYASLRRGSRAVFQFYPENAEQMELITAMATRSGFAGGLVIDFPNSSKAKKYFLCLFAGPPSQAPELPQGLAEDDTMESHTHMRNSVMMDVSDNRGKTKRRRGGTRKHKPNIKSRNWILHKKEVMRARGKQTAKDSKYTGRQRSGKFRV